MMTEETYICWHANQNEEDGKEIKALSLKAAAKKAVDIWRHENGEEIRGRKVTVYLRDEARRVHEVVITSDNNPAAPEAFA